MKVIIWKHGEAWAVRTPDWNRRMYGFESREAAKEYAKETGKRWGESKAPTL